jgi:hypothetical protein
MRTKTITLYEFDELSEQSKEIAVQRLSDINVDHEWYDFTLEDSERIGLKITDFEIYRKCKGEILTSHYEVAEAILKEHGDQCETYKTAQTYLKERHELTENAVRDENDELSEEDNERLDDIEEDFLKSLLEDYRIILQKEYEYLTSKEAIIETIKANEYTFTEDGKLEN